MKWTVNGFSYILDTASQFTDNFSMDENNDPRSLNSFTYGWELVKSLCNPQMGRRKAIINLPKSSVAKINIILGNPVLAPVVIVPDELYSYKAETRRCTPCL